MKSTVIKCHGVKDGAECWFIWRKGRFVASDPKYVPQLYEIQAKARTMGGTYYLTPKDPLTAAEVGNRFFDRFNRMECNGDAPQLPYEPGVIY